MAESPTTLEYPTETAAGQLTGGSSFNTTTNTWVPGSGAVVLAEPAAAGTARDPGNIYECQLPDGSGLADTTYTLTAAQIAAGALMGA